MDTKKLKLYAGTTVKESKMSVPAKIQMFQFIKEASDAQIKALLMDGKITRLDEQAEQIVNDRFKLFKLPQKNINEMFEFTSAVTRAAEAGQKVINACNKKGGDKVNCKKLGAAKSISVLKSAVSSCKDAGNPQKCLVRMKKAIADFSKV